MVTQAYWGGLPFALLIGGGLAYGNTARLRAVAKLFLKATVEALEMNPDSQAGVVSVGVEHEFSGPQEVEITSRVVRRVLGERTRDPRFVLASEAILQAGMRQFPESVFLLVAYDGFVSEVLADPQSGHGYSDKARGLNPAMPNERFAVFARDKSYKTRMQGTENMGGENSMDLVGCARVARHNTTQPDGPIAAWPT